MILDPNGFFKQATQFNRTEINVPEPMIKLFQANAKTGNCRRDRDPFVAPANTAILTDQPSLEVSRIDKSWKHSRQWARGRGVQGCRSSQVDSFMRPETIVFVTKAIEPPLLLRQVSSRRTRSLRLQDTVHPFMLPVLLGLSWLNQLRSDAEPDPPDGKLGVKAVLANAIESLAGR